MTINILGISAYYHDSAAALLCDGKIVFAAQEERFSRKKHDSAFPSSSIKACLAEVGIVVNDIDYIVFYDKPLLKFERLLETYLAYTPRGFKSFLIAIPVWLKEKLFLKSTLKNELAKLGNIDKKYLPPLLFNQHHHSHAASAFYPSPFDEAAVICLDGVGEWATSSVWLGKGNSLKPLWELDFPHSLGLLYSAFTYYTGFKVNSGEYKLMGLAPYGKPKYVDLIFDNLIDLKEDGTFRLDMSYFNYPAGLTMTNAKFDRLFDGPVRKAESEITQREMDIARSIQFVTEEIVLKLVNTIHKELNMDYLCLAGGVALNCVSNGRILRESPFKDIWIQPAAGDAGGAIGSAMSVWHDYLGRSRSTNGKDLMSGSYLGTRYCNSEIVDYLDEAGATYRIIQDKELMPMLAEQLNEQKIIGWFQGRMEFGPRALGGRSIIGDPRSPKMQSVMNLKIKYRESFRPFAPAIKAESVSEWFDIDRASPYMLFVASIKENKRKELSEEHDGLLGIDKLNVVRSEIPAVTHIDYSARIQTIHNETNPRFYALVSAFEELTQCPILINTSFNVRGEPIVCTPKDAYRCFMRTEMDILVLEDVLLFKNEQPLVEKDNSWKNEFELD